MNSRSEEASQSRDSEQFIAKTKRGGLWKRSMWMAHAGTQANLYGEASKGKAALPKAIDYLKIRVVLWVWHYLRSRFGPKHDFLDYTNSKDDNGIYDLAASPGSADPVTVSLIGDWGTGTNDARDVAGRVNLDSPHFTVHLGDIYYVGTMEEIRENMFGENTGVVWPAGSSGSFALNANHEMYSRGFGYFDTLLPALGIKNGAGQKASFFCLKNEHWLVIGLDTGYYSVGTPIIEMIFKPSAKLHEKLIAWLREDVQLDEDDQRGVILLSHHQYYSQFESGHDVPAGQIAGLIDRPVLWFWGHEHRFGMYRRHASENAGLHAYGRCIGHGGLPIEDIRQEPKSGQKYQVGLVLYDKRKRPEENKLLIPVGYNGYANLVFEGNRLTVEYKDTKQALVREIWEVGEGGRLKGISADRIITDADLVLHDGSTMDDAIV